MTIRISSTYQSCPVGPLPILIPFLKKIGLRNIVDTLVPTTKRANITHGQVIEALVLNRLLSPRALYTVDDWSQFLLLSNILGVSPNDLNDDRITRTLDAIFPVLEQLNGTLAWRIMEVFAIDASFFHWDMTSFFFEGSYPEEKQDAAAPVIKRGRPKPQDAGKSRKQMQVGFAVSSDHGVPLWHRAFSGNAAEVSQVGDVMESLKKVVGKSSFTLIGDSKLLSQKNIATALRLGLSFLAPESRSNFHVDEYFDGRAKQGLQRFAVPTKAKKKPIYMGFEKPIVLNVDGEPQTLRRLFIVSSEERRATRRSRKRQQRKLQEGIDKAKRNLGRYSYTTPQKVAEKMEQLLAKTDLQDVLHYRVEGEGKEMQLHIHTDQEAFKRLRQTDGAYTLLTNLPEEYDVETLLVRYKRQFLSEQRFADVKGPLQLRPLFLKKNRRIVSLVSTVAVALTIYCLIEYTIRKNLKEAKATITDPYSKRPSPEPTTRRLMAAFEFFGVGKDEQNGQITYTVPEFNELQKQILEQLDIQAPLSFLSGSPSS